MKLTPLDIRHKEFSRGMRGYSDTEVDEFLDLVADELERVIKENLDLNERVEALQQQIAHYRSIEATLQKTLLSAQQSAEDMRASAQKEAQLVLRDAEVKARDSLGEAYSAKQQIERDMVMLKNTEAEFRFKFRALLEGYLKQLGAVEDGARERATEFEERAKALRDAIVAGGAAAAPATAPGPDVAPTRPPAPPVAAAPAPASPPSSKSTAPHQAATSQPPQSAATAPASAASPAQAVVQTLDDGEDTAVLAGLDTTVDVRPLTDEENDFFSDVDHKLGGNDFKW